MHNLQLLARRALPALLFLMASLIIATSGHPQLVKWSGQLTYLPVISLLIAALVAMKFSRSRMVLCCLLLVSMEFTGFWPALGELAGVTLPVTAILMAQLGWLLWSRDKGFAPLNATISLSQLAAVAVGTTLLFHQLRLQPQSWLAPINAWLYPDLARHFSALEAVFYLLVLLLGLGRLAFNPTNNHCALFVSMLMLPILQYQSQPLVSQVALFALAVLFLFSIILDSHNMAFRDELTGIPSRRALMQYVQTLGGKYVVVMADIDHFKAFNDTYGHDVGDQVLRMVASRMTGITGGGRAFRYGGEEFTLVFARKDADQVEEHVESLRRSIADYKMVIRAPDRPVKKSRGKKKPVKKSGLRQLVQVTCSFGVAEKGKDQGSFEAVMKQADVALYQAKKAGRNCVKLS